MLLAALAEADITHSLSVFLKELCKHCNTNKMTIKLNIMQSNFPEIQNAGGKSQNSMFVCKFSLLFCFTVAQHLTLVTMT